MLFTLTARHKRNEEAVDVKALNHINSWQEKQEFQRKGQWNLKKILNTYRLTNLMMSERNW